MERETKIALSGVLVYVVCMVLAVVSHARRYLEILCSFTLWTNTLVILYYLVCLVSSTHNAVTRLLTQLAVPTMLFVGVAWFFHLANPDKETWPEYVFNICMHYVTPVLAVAHSVSRSMPPEDHRWSVAAVPPLVFALVYVYAVYWLQIPYYPLARGNELLFIFEYIVCVLVVKY